MLFLLVSLLPGTTVQAADDPLDVYVVNYPLKYFAERIGGARVKVTLPVPAEVDPVYWTPGIAAIGAYQQADLILLNGAGYAKWVSKVSLPRSKTVDTSRAFKDRYITVKETMTHSHGAEGEHAHEGLAFTTWLDLSLAASQAEAIAEALARKQPQHQAWFRANFQSLQKDLLSLHGQIQAVVSKNHSVPVLFSHPVYDYFEEAYGLNGRSVHWEPDQAPSPAQVADLNEILRKHPARWMIWEGQPIEAGRDRLAAMDIQSTVFDPCGNVPAEGDFLSVMQGNIANLEPVFR
jgi:zinc transport system substrate-binding protein